LELLELGSRAGEDGRHPSGGPALAVGCRDLGAMASVVEQPPRLDPRAFERGRAVFVELLRVGPQLRGVDLGRSPQLTRRGLGVGEDAGTLALGRGHGLVRGGPRLFEQLRGPVARLVQDRVGAGAGLLPHAARLDPGDFETLDALVVRVLRRHPQPMCFFFGRTPDLGRGPLGLGEQGLGLGLGLGLRGLDGLRERPQHGRDLHAGLVDRHVGGPELMDLELEAATLLVGGAQVSGEGRDLRVVVRLVPLAPGLTETRGFHLVSPWPWRPQRSYPHLPGRGCPRGDDRSPAAA
jgi:hypothetical protein